MVGIMRPIFDILGNPVTDMLRLSVFVYCPVNVDRLAGSVLCPEGFALTFGVVLDHRVCRI